MDRVFYPMNTRARFLPGRSPRLFLALAIAVALTLAGCSATGIAYNNAVFFVMGYADDYLNLTAEQDSRLRAQFSRIQDAHREEALPRYVALLRATQDALDQGMDPAEIGCFVRAVEVMYADLMQRLVPLAANALSDLSEEQRQTLAEAISEENEDYAEKYLEGNAEERIQKRAQNLAMRLKFWIGPLTEAQQRDLEGLLAELPDRFDEWRAYRAGKQRELLALADAGATRGQFEVFLKGWWVEHAGWPHTTEVRKSITRILLVLQEGMTPEQRRYATKRFDSLANGLEGLIPEDVVTVQHEQICALVAASRH
jgi:predicted transcriptional regulator